MNVLIKNGDELKCDVTFNGNKIIQESSLGFEFKGEATMGKGLSVIDNKEQIVNRTWNPVIKSKHVRVLNHSGNPKVWKVEYGKYSKAQESEFFERLLSYVIFDRL